MRHCVHGPAGYNSEFHPSSSDIETETSSVVDEIHVNCYPGTKHILIRLSRESRKVYHLYVMRCLYYG